MGTPFIMIHSDYGRIGRLCWVNSDLRRTLIPEGWWGSVFMAGVSPARPGEAW